MGRSEPESFREFVHARSSSLQRSAWLLTGDRHAAEDLVQAALERCWLRWDRLDLSSDPEPYVRRVLLSVFLTWRRRFWRREQPSGQSPVAGTASPSADSDLRLVVAAALAALPPRQRAAVVCRYFDDLSEAQTAAVMGCTVGTVKSQTAKALGKLRADARIQELLAEEVR